MRIAGAAYPSDVATVVTYGGTERTYDVIAGEEGAHPAAWVTIEPDACMVVASFTIVVQQPGGSWAEPSDTPGYTRYFQPIAVHGETWSSEHANVRVIPQRNPSLETADGQTPRPPGEEGKLTAMEGDQAFQMTAEEVAGDDYAEKQKTEAELAENQTWAREQESQSAHEKQQKEREIDKTIKEARAEEAARKEKADREEAARREAYAKEGPAREQQTRKESREEEAPLANGEHHR
jgi:hypothetical protein